jgi:hypothetical protein
MHTVTKVVGDNVRFRAPLKERLEFFIMPKVLAALSVCGHYRSDTWGGRARNAFLLNSASVTASYAMYLVSACCECKIVNFVRMVTT